MASDLGRSIAEARSRRSWSLADVSSRTGLSRAYINALEHGRSRRPGADALRRLEDVLGPLSPGGQLPTDVPAGLRRLAEERRIPTSEIQMLAGIKVAGRRPVSAERWRFIYDAILASESLDDERE
jgi:transcriptional regulator with XRE-family HTH domain